MTEIKQAVMSDEDYEAVKVHLESLVACNHMSVSTLRATGVDHDAGALAMMLSMGVFLANAKMLGISDEHLVAYLRAQLTHNNRPDDKHLN